MVGPRTARGKNEKNLMRSVFSHARACVLKHAKDRRNLPPRPRLTWIPVVKDCVFVQQVLSQKLGSLAAFLFRSVCVGHTDRFVLDYILNDVFREPLLLELVRNELKNNSDPGLVILATIRDRKWVCARRLVVRDERHVQSLLRLNRLLCFYTFLSQSLDPDDVILDTYVNLRSELLSTSCFDGFSAHINATTRHTVVVKTPTDVADVVDASKP